MNVAFTVCSANYLPFAKTLADSLVKHNPAYKFIIALADTYTGYDAAFFSPHQIIPVEEMQISALREMNRKYNIFELCCALKPFVADYLFTTIQDCECLFYFDADIQFYNSLEVAEQCLQNHSILLVPHFTKLPSCKTVIQTELNVLRTGLYNAGFFGLKKGSSSFQFLAWWQERLENHCFDDALHGVFVDQLWLNYVPLYFPDSFVLQNPGYNLAYWNFEERNLSQTQGTYLVNEKYPLVFFHFSGYNVYQPEVISMHQKQISFSQLPQYNALFEEHAKGVLNNNSADYLLLSPGMGRLAPKMNGKKSLSRFKKLKGTLQKIAYGDNTFSSFKKYFLSRL